MDNQQLRGYKMSKCPECGIEVEGKKFCSKSCAVKYNNRLRVQNGTCNLLKKNGGSELARRHNLEMSKQGIHPFLKGNFSEETRAENGKKHSKWVLENQCKTGEHPWTLRESRINNEYSRELSIYNRRGVTKLYLYVAKVPGFDSALKIGVSSDLSMRLNDGRFPISDIKELKFGDTNDILKMERDLKRHFSSDDTFSKYSSYEILDVSEIDIINFISQSSTTIETTP